MLSTLIEKLDARVVSHSKAEDRDTVVIISNQGCSVNRTVDYYYYYYYQKIFDVNKNREVLFSLS